jgi:hypothetical protein
MYIVSHRQQATCYTVFVLCILQWRMQTSAQCNIISAAPLDISDITTDEQNLFLIRKLTGAKTYILVILLQIIIITFPISFM